MIKFSLDKQKSDLPLRMKVLGKIYPGALSAAMRKAGLALWDDTINIGPKPPIDTGHLRGSGNLYTATGPAPAPAGIRQVGATEAGTVKTKPGEAIFGLNTPYAARLHELPAPYLKHKRPEANQDSGPKFIKRKLERFHKDYVKLAADEFDKQISSK